MHHTILTVAVALTLLAASTADAGRYPGPGIASGRVFANSTFTYTEVFNAGENAFVNVKGDGYTDLDLFVYDELGNLICSDTDFDDMPRVGFRPHLTSKFTIKIVNRGNTYNDFTIRTN